MEPVECHGLLLEDDQWVVARIECDLDHETGEVTFRVGDRLYWYPVDEADENPLIDYQEEKARWRCWKLARAFHGVWMDFYGLQLPVTMQPHLMRAGCKAICNACGGYVFGQTMDDNWNGHCPTCGGPPALPGPQAALWAMIFGLVSDKSAGP